MKVKAQINPKSDRISDLRAVLDGRFSKQVWQYTVSSTGGFTLYGTLAGTLRDVVQFLEKNGYTA
jgi:hypothetical protein